MMYDSYVYQVRWDVGGDGTDFCVHAASRRLVIKCAAYKSTYLLTYLLTKQDTRQFRSAR